MLEKKVEELGTICIQAKPIGNIVMQKLYGELVGKHQQLCGLAQQLRTIGEEQSADIVVAAAAKLRLVRVILDGRDSWVISKYEKREPSLTEIHRYCMLCDRAMEESWWVYLRVPNLLVLRGRAMVVCQSCLDTVLTKYC